MNVNQRDRSWRFLHPDLDAPEACAGLALALTGGIALVEGDAAVRQAVLLLLTTSPGERVMRPEYGCNLRRLLFWPNDATTAGLAIHYVREALDRWETRIDILRIDAERNTEEPSRLDVVVEYRVRASRGTDKVALSIDLTSPGA